jgi:hypothetical protein
MTPATRVESAATDAIVVLHANQGDVEDLVLAAVDPITS